MKTTELFNLTGKVAIVTGGSIGLGAQMAIGLAEAGANVVVAARKIERCVALCEKIESETGVKALPVKCDTSLDEDCRNLIDATVKEFGTVDILVNNAGITWGADAINYPMDRWQKLLDVNLTGVFRCCMYAAQVMKEKGGGKIINISSTTGYGGTYPEAQDTVAYNASKGAVMVLTKDLGVKWARHNIHVNGIAPGPFVTHMTEKHFANVGEEAVRGANPLGRYGSAWDLKGAAVFLASPASDFITGATIPVDGGSHALA